MSNRFDLEQEITKFSMILDDLHELVNNDRLTENNVLALTEYYHIRYEMLWATFEQFVKNMKTSGYGGGG